MALADVLVPWFRAHARDLPWRRPGTTAWGVLVWRSCCSRRRWSASSPLARVDAALAGALRAGRRAGRGEVLRAWGKLGYPRRALRLHDAARGDRRRARRRGARPTSTTLEALPGIGDLHRPRRRRVRLRTARAGGRHQRPPGGGARRARRGPTPVPPSTARDLADVEALLPADDADAAVISAALMELGATGLHGPRAALRRLPGADACAWQRHGRPPCDGPARRGPEAGRAPTGRSAAGCSTSCAAPPARWRGRRWTPPGPPTPPSAARCLDSLLVDGLVEQTADGRFALAGESGDPPEAP